MTTTVQSILREKGNQVWSVVPTASIRQALERMAEKKIGAVLVMDGSSLLGIFSERDYARRGVLMNRGPETPVGELMSFPVFCVSPLQTIEECMQLMTEKHIRHLPVTDGVNILGVISIGDVVKEVIADQRHEIQGLENYILGKRA
ncbi:predicted signal-transduction protein containing cAMP-binding and CBS domains [Longilinea arvoryzae]|uniref:Predicted signal-transduction protein containing cAMP-binding and CBS domains n=1 Tax=Longilinea arvoryzae TaxID=360412 RepID=A0A0S7BHZ5_9CHLR|nr:CBS domain-containing protein [Longilinea arvoryzae]GAP13896.1 predicted signal-transduction protein containing cAMP-binding and CBS domains [Longilinea arvoryzae]